MGKHARVISRKSNPQLMSLINKLYSLSAAQESSIWRDVARRLERSTKGRATVNLSKLDRIAGEGETVLVPGKLLGFGNISKKLTVSAYTHSGSAQKKLSEAGCSLMSIEELLEANPKGSNIKIIV